MSVVIILGRFLATRHVARCMSSSEAAPSTTGDSSPIPPPPVDGQQREYPEKLRNIVESISKLTLLEASQLNDLLKVLI